MTFLLTPLGWFYGALMRLRRRLYAAGILESHPLPGLVISVGNIEVGGTGKSPVVMALAEALVRRGARPAILTRGYRSGLGADESLALVGSRVVISPERTRNFHADEATMQAQRLGQVPVIVGAQRWEAAQRYLEQFPAPTHWILDDGFQHLRLKRQVDIVLLNAKAPFANGRCLPAGRLREVPGTLAKADIVLLTRATSASIPEAVQREARAGALILPASFIEGQPRQVAGPSASFNDQTALILALGIAQPTRIQEHCRQHRYPISEQILVGDHELFPWTEMQRLTEKAGGILTTEKDYWRQESQFQALHLPVYILPLDLELDLPKILATFTEN